MVKIITMCRQGLVRSVALADVLKLHFEPVDVIPIGHFGNTDETKKMLFHWADYIVVMEHHYLKHVPDIHLDKTFVCEVGPDNYGSSKHPQLIGTVWRWARDNQDALGIKEHNKRV